METNSICIDTIRSIGKSFLNSFSIYYIRNNRISKKATIAFCITWYLNFLFIKQCRNNCWIFLYCCCINNGFSVRKVCWNSIIFWTTWSSNHSTTSKVLWGCLCWSFWLGWFYCRMNSMELTPINTKSLLKPSNHVIVNANLCWIS